MATPEKPWKAEYAKSGRSSCRTCKSPISKEVLRLGKMVQSQQFDGFMPVEGVVAVAEAFPKNTCACATKLRIEVFKNRCSYLWILQLKRFATVEVRISSKPEGQGARGLAWHHATCFLDSSPTTQLEKLDGWESLSDSNKSAVISMVKTVSATKKGKDEVKEEKETLKGSAKRKGAVDRDQKLKMAKTEDDNKNNELDPSKLQSLLEAQTKELWALKDDLKNHVSTAELREMLEANNQSTSGSELDLRDRWTSGSPKLKACGQTLAHPKVKKDTNCLVVCGVPDNLHAEMRKERMKVPIVREDYLADCFERRKKLRLDMYKIEAGEEASKSMVTVKVKGRSAVHESSGLQDPRPSYYYILQIIEDDKGSDCHVFRKWGRVGNEKIGGTKLEEFSKTDAIKEFKRLFLEKTGNSWEAWEQKKLQKQPGKFYPLDIVLSLFPNYFRIKLQHGWDYGVNKDSPKKNKIKDAKSQLAPPLADLMKMLFNVETYRYRSIDGASDSIERDEVKMLEALQDIEIASRLVGFDADNDDSIDDKYKKLQCEMYMTTSEREGIDYRAWKKIPNESEHVKWRDDVVVPCGKPVSSNVKATELMYNEYIVYNPDQVKLQFLLKVRFRYKSLHAHLTVLSNEDLKGTRIEHEFKQADVETFTSTMLLNVDQLEKQLDKDGFQKNESMAAFWMLNKQFQKFINSQFPLDYDSQMTNKYFVEYTPISSIRSFL
ncbi:poly [ADP-ribose] polymerase 1 [Tanacetum coccineum]